MVHRTRSPVIHPPSRLGARKFKEKTFQKDFCRKYRTFIDLFVAKPSFQAKCDIPKLSHWHHCSVHHSSPAGPSCLIEGVQESQVWRGHELSSGKLWILSRCLHTKDVWWNPTGNGRARSMLIFYSLTCCYCHSVQPWSWCALEKQDEAKLSGNALKMPDSCRWEKTVNSKFQP